MRLRCSATSVLRFAHRTVPTIEIERKRGSIFLVAFRADGGKFGGGSLEDRSEGIRRLEEGNVGVRVPWKCRLGERRTGGTGFWWRWVRRGGLEAGWGGGDVSRCAFRLLRWCIADRWQLLQGHHRPCCSSRQRLASFEEPSMARWVEARNNFPVALAANDVRWAAYQEQGAGSDDHWDLETPQSSFCSFPDDACSQSLESGGCLEDGLPRRRQFATT